MKQETTGSRLVAMNDSFPASGTLKFTAAEFRAMKKPVKTKPTKYRAVKTGQFDSKAEAARHAELLLLEKQGLISQVSVHPWFELQAAFNSKSGGHYRAINYEADFTYYETRGNETRLVIEDVKGFQIGRASCRERV